MGTITSFPINTINLSEAPEILNLSDELANHRLDNVVHVNKQYKEALDVRMSNIERSLAGITFDFEEDAGETYSVPLLNRKTVQTRQKKLGGKSIPWNQIAYAADRSSATDGISYSMHKNIITYNGTTTRAFAQARFDVVNVPIVQNHVYCLICLISGTANQSYGVLACRSGSTTTNLFTTDSVRAMTRQVKISTANMSGEGSLAIFVFANGSGVTVSGTATLYAFDLTRIFGKGNEPTDVDDERIAMLESIGSVYPDYDEGSIKSADVNEINSTGINLCDLSVFGVASNNGVTATPLSNGKIKFTGTPTISSGIIITYGASATHTSVDISKLIIGHTYSVFKTFNTGGIQVTRQNGQVDYVNSFIYSSDIIAVRPYLQPAFAHYTDGMEIGTVLYDTTITPTLSEYIPYKEDSVAIPQLLRSDYPLRSAGSVHDEYDFERMKFVQRVGAVDLGTLTWSLQSSVTTGKRRYAATISNIILHSDPRTVGNLACSHYANVSPNDTYLNKNGIAANQYEVVIYDEAHHTETVNEFKTLMSGVMLHYELATPVEHDISSYMIGQPIMKAEGGGSITYKQETGTMMPVPYSIENLIYLKSEGVNG